MKRITLLILCNLLLMTQVSATDSIESEASHLIGGAILAGGLTAVVDRYYPEHRHNRKMIGFKISSATVIALQILDYSRYGNVEGQLLDAASHIIGSAIGAWATDKYILMPVVKHTSNNGKYVGVALHYTF